MPTYEYACTECGQHIEVFQRLSDEPLTVCGVCGGPLRKVFHPAGILFKGSGFYTTDSRSKSKAGVKSSESTGASESGSKADPSGGGKTEAKGESGAAAAKEKTA